MLIEYLTYVPDTDSYAASIHRRPLLSGRRIPQGISKE